jgi:hypothetical protein
MSDAPPDSPSKAPSLRSSSSKSTKSPSNFPSVDSQTGSDGFNPFFRVGGTESPSVRPSKGSFGGPSPSFGTAIRTFSGELPWDLLRRHPRPFHPRYCRPQHQRHFPRPSDLPSGSLPHTPHLRLFLLLLLFFVDDTIRCAICPSVCKTKWVSFDDAKMASFPCSISCSNRVVAVRNAFCQSILRPSYCCIGSWHDPFSASSEDNSNSF